MSTKEKFNSLMLLDSDNPLSEEIDKININDLTVLCSNLLAHPFGIFMAQIRFTTNDA